MSLQESDREILDSAVARLDELGLAPRVELPGPSEDLDARITITVEGKKLVLPVWVKHGRGYSPPVIASLMRRAEGDPVLVTDHVTPAAEETLRQLQVEFIDAAGNMYVSREGILRWVTGLRPARAIPVERPTRAFRRAGLQVVFVLLAQPELVRAPYRRIADVAGVSLGTIPSVIEELRELGHVIGPASQRSLAGDDRLLASWTDAYAQTLRPRLLLERFRADDPDWWQTVDPTRYGASWGGETAAHLLTRHLTPEISTVYATSLPRELLLAARLRRDPGGDVLVRRRFWRDVLPTPRPDVVPAPLVYADLLATGDARTAEVADMVKEDHLVRSERPQRGHPPAGSDPGDRP